MIAILDPSLKSNKGDVSINLGDLIIRKAIYRELKELFPNQEFKSISTHSYLGKKELDIIKSSEYTFIGGSNLLSSHILAYNQWKVRPISTLYFLNPKIQQVVLFGVGWWQYQGKADFITKHFYKSVLHGNKLHSVRSGYAKKQLEAIGLKNVLNTTCPTIWNLDGVNVDRTNLNVENSIFTLTDYNKDVEMDSTLIKSLLKYFKKLCFFAQGSKDEEYLKSLGIYTKNKNRFKIIKSIEGFNDHLNPRDFTYVGTRLHGGIYAKQKGVESLIIAIDNRAEEIAKDVNIPIMKRKEFYLLHDWLEGKTQIGKIQLNKKAINQWRSQFK